METPKVGIREFRENLATYLESTTPVAITRHGATIGVYVPTRPKPSEADIEGPSSCRCEDAGDACHGRDRRGRGHRRLQEAPAGTAAVKELTKIVLDANILIRAVLGSRVLGILRSYADQVEFYSPDRAFEDARKWLPGILARRRGDPVQALEMLDLIRTAVCVLSSDAYRPFETVARDRISRRDPDDWPILAAALALNCPIWTEDTDFFGCGVATWTTDRVEIFFNDYSNR